MSERRHEVIRASAGTGKTHALALRFLTLLFDGVGPERILATTFTKKAAGEILERVFERLVDAAREPDALATLADQLGDAAGEVTAGRCEALVAELAKQLDRFQVRTLDSFFARIARLYAYELGLPPDWRVADEAELAEQSEEAVGQLLLEDDSEEGRASILELLRALQGSNPANSVTASLLRTIRSGLDVWTEAEPEAWDRIRLPEGLEPSRLEELLVEFERHPMPQTKKGTNNSNWANSIAKAVAQSRAGDWEGLLASGIVKAVADGKDQFYRHTICDELHALLEPLIRHAQRDALATVVARNLATRSLLERYSHHLEVLQRDSGVLGFSDVPRAIAPASGDEPLTERELDMWFRLDGRVDHLLLDEFQDTSSMQWRILGRLAEEILAEAPGDRSLFCVGDGKQSIYGFRQAEPRLLDQVAEPDIVAKLELTRSFRSAQPVLDTVNAVFDSLGTNEAIRTGDGDNGAAIQDAASSFSEGYPAHTSARASLQGSVVLLEPEPYEPGDAPDPVDGETEPGPTPEERVLELAAQRVAALHQEAPAATIGVLLRNRGAIPSLLRQLDQLGVAASGEGGNPLTDASCVVEVLALLHFADYPGDTAAAFHVVRSGLGLRIDLDDGSTPVEREAAALRVRREVQTFGFGGFLAGLEAEVAQRHPDDWQQSRFRQLIELAHAQDARGSVRPSAFVRQVHGTKVESSNPARVKVMTIHASKGLGFDAVVLPELDRALLAHSPAFLLSRPDPGGPIEAISHCPNKQVRSYSPDLLELWAGHVEFTLRDSLCLLYVAMTRAARRLEMIVQPTDPEKSAPRLSWARILRAALVDEGVQDPGESATRLGAAVVLAESGAGADWAADRREAPLVQLDPAPKLTPGLGLPPAQHTGIASATSLAADARPAAARLAAPDHQARRRGVQLHKLLASIEWLEDLGPEPTASPELVALLTGIEPNPTARESLLDGLRAALAKPQIAAALTRPPAGTPPEVRRERRFCLRPRTGPMAGRLVQGAMDRVHITRASGEVTAATIYDYKSGANPDDATEQLELYRHVLATQLKLDPDAIQTQALALS